MKIMKYAVGIIVLFILLIQVVKAESELDFIPLPEKGDCVGEANKFKVFQVLAPTAALASEKNDLYDTMDIYNGLTVLFVNDERKYYYDDQIIKISKKQCARQVGIFKYQTKDDNYKTVPIVIIDSVD
ncbi:MAG: hypothetical protein FWE18_04320 [Alphaproteobacteria bacterium]|nr:hypothetical protein [Alphaproteobacteria bacterium]